MIELQNITKSYRIKGQSVEALKAVNIKVAAGEIFGVIGPSGAGKSTLIRCVNFLERPDKGDVIVDGQALNDLSKTELRTLRHQIGMVFQHFNLLSSRTVFANVAFQLELLGASKADIEKDVMAMLKLVGIDDKRDVYPSQLSGGQKQRVAIARALVTKPKVLLCDEMTSSLDPETTYAILDLLKQLQQELSLTILLITHEMDVIKRIADRVAVIVDGEIIESSDVLSVFKNPRHYITKQFVRSDLKRFIPDNIENVNTLVQIAFVGKTATQPIIEKLINHSKVHVNILQANLEQLRNEMIGVMTVDLQGSSWDVAQALKYLQELGLAVEVIKDVSRTLSSAPECELADA